VCSLIARTCSGSALVAAVTAFTDEQIPAESNLDVYTVLGR